MALSSDDWPRFSLLAGASDARVSTNASSTSTPSCHLRPSSEQTARELLDVACSGDASSTWECWLQLRVSATSRRESDLQLSERKLNSDDGARSVCWIIRTPAWSCGVDSDGACVALVGSTLHTASSCDTSDPETMLQLAAGRWHHFAVVRNPSSPALELFVDGHSVLLHTKSSKTNASALIGGGDAAGFLIGVAAPHTQTRATCVMHDLRVWRCALGEDAIAAWLHQSVSTAHPHFTSLFAHWGLSSCSSSEVELDLSGSNRHLTIVRAGSSARKRTAYWLRIAPPRLVAAAPSNFIVETLQNASTCGSECRFQIKIRHRRAAEYGTFRTSAPALEPRQAQHGTQAYIHKQQPRILFVCNFRCFKSTSVTKPGEGKWLIALLQECICNLSESALVGIFKPSTEQANHPSELVRPPVFMTRTGKIQTCKTFEQLAIMTPVSDAESFLASVASGIGTFLEVSASLQNDSTPTSESSTTEVGLSYTSVVVINGSLSAGAAENPEIYEQARQKLAASLEETDKERMSIYFLHLHSPPTLSSAALNASRLFTEYASCERDVEWVLASVMHRISQVACANARLRFQVFGDDEDDIEGGGSTKLTLESHNMELVSSEACPGDVITIDYGLCARTESLVLSGTFAASPKTRLPFVELSFEYSTHDRQVQVVRTSIRLQDDLTNDMHIARVRRSESLALLRGDSSLLLEQRRQLMDEKEQFHRTLVTREVGELENSFKRVNIMKEELWAKRKWIIQRGLRYFEEDELHQLDEEAREAMSAFTERLEALQIMYTANARENSRGGGTGGDRDSTHRVQNELYTDDVRRHSSGSDGDGDEEETSQEELVQRFEKLVVKVDLLSTQFRDLESRMEDMNHSVGVSQSKGFVIMNDTRKAWMVMFDDLMASKRKVLQTTRERTSAEFTVALLEHKQATRDQMLAEIKRINSRLLNYEKEHVKRKKRVFFCMKEVIGVMQREAEAAFGLDATTQAARQCKLLRSPPLDDPALYGSCVYVFFPPDAWHQRGVTSDDMVSGHSHHRLNNTVHSLLFGLRHFCHEANQAPFCRRIALQENFLWLDQEQLCTTNEHLDADAELSIAKRRERVQEESWAVIIVSYNALFESPAAVIELKRVLLFAEQRRKPVLHLELEASFPSLNVFKSFRNKASGEGAPTKMQPLQQQVPVEKQYLTYKQNLGYFQAALAKINSTNASKHSGSLTLTPLKRECTRCSEGGKRAKSSMLPCVPCCWSTLARSTLDLEGSFASSSEQQSDHEFFDTVSSVGQWIDALALSATIASSVRSHNIDPRGASPLFLKLECFWSVEVTRYEALWEESFSRRSAEINRQLQKLFAVNDEEANELVQLQFTFTTRKQLLAAACSEKIQDFQEELKLLRALAELKASEDLTEPAVQAKELALMMELDLAQALSESDQLMAKLDQLEEANDDENDTNSNPNLYLQIKQTFHESLKRSCQRILERGKHLIENQLRAITKHFAKQQERDEMQQLKAQCEFERCEIRRIESIFDQGIDILSRRIAEREQEIVDEVHAFVQVSRLEQRKFSLAVSGNDLSELRKCARDVDEQSKLRVAVLFDKLLSELMMDTAQAFRAKTEHAIQIFVSFYAPSPAPAEHGHEENVESTQTSNIPRDVLRLKDLCSLNINEPRKTWESLQQMVVLAKHEVLNVRQAKHLACDFKMRFQEKFVASQLESSHVYSQRYVEHLTDLLAHVKSEKDQSFATRMQCKRLLRTTIEDREQCKQRALVLQSKLADAKRRNLYLLQILQQCRASYEKATHMSELLGNFKVDPLFKSWFAVGEFHTSSVEDWYELRVQCAEDVARLEAELKVLERQLERLHESIEQRRLQWVKASVADVAICERAEQLQDLVHHAVDQVVETEEARVFHLLSCFDVRRKWLDEVHLKRLHLEQTSSPLSSAEDAAGGGSGGERSVNQNLVMLSIARLDSIKQEKLYYSLVRKLRVYERIRKQEIEKHQMVSDEIQQHRALSDRLLQRVNFVTQQMQALSKGRSNSVMKRDASGGTAQLLAAQQEFETLKVSVSRDHLFSEAHLCQLCWRLQEQVATSHRINTVIQKLTGEIKTAENYLGILKATDSMLYNQGIADRGDTSEVKAEVYGARIQSHLPFVLHVYEYYARQRWSVQSLERTTLINEKLRQCREHLAYLNTKNGGSSSNAAAKAKYTDTGGPYEEMDEETEQQLRESLAVDIMTGELALLLNRFECRVAEHTSEALWDKLDALADLGCKSLSWNSNSGKNTSSEYEGGQLVGSSSASLSNELQAVRAVTSKDQLSSWLFSRDLCETQKNKALCLLYKVTTNVDPRDVGGNIAEVVYGASLDSNEIKQIYLTKAKHHIEEQWRVTCLVVLFFARLFRRVALQKAAKQRKVEAAGLTSTTLAQHKEFYKFAKVLHSQLSASKTASAFNWDTLTRQRQQTAKGRTKEGRRRLKNCLRLVQLEHQEHGVANVVARIRDGLILARPLHHALGELYDPNHEVLDFALRLEHVRADFEHQPLTPSGLELVAAENNFIKIKWTPLQNDTDLLYAAEIQRWEPLLQPKRRGVESTTSEATGGDGRSNDSSQPQEHGSSTTVAFWNLFVSDSKQSHTFYKLQTGETYCVRVRSGVSKSKWGKASRALFVKLR